MDNKKVYNYIKYDYMFIIVNNTELKYIYYNSLIFYLLIFNMI